MRQLTSKLSRNLNSNGNGCQYGYTGLIRSKYNNKYTPVWIGEGKFKAINMDSDLIQIWTKPVSFPKPARLSVVSTPFMHSSTKSVSSTFCLRPVMAFLSSHKRLGVLLSHSTDYSHYFCSGPEGPSTLVLSATLRDQTFAGFLSSSHSSLYKTEILSFLIGLLNIKSVG
ncbi:Hypothetical predicted protein [Podarcis lilfordi]|uniref:Uncharacterized protein n=1 Tax=Podarcis lilfordi TaxID=74358 RepID=A0AA35KK34_9SAUR|nr:Hypothetical predicted protein [Podarcis lilfordi]